MRGRKVLLDSLLVVAGIVVTLFLVYCSDGPISPPLIIEDTSPDNGATNVSTSIYVYVKFNMSMDTATVETATDVTSSDGSSVAKGFIWETSAESNDVMYIIFNPNLAYSTTYTVTIGTEAESQTGKTLSDPYQFSFTTEQADPPFVASSNPADGATNVSVFVSAKVHFSEAMSQASLEPYSDVDVLGTDGITPYRIYLSWDDADTLNIDLKGPGDSEPGLAYSMTYTITVRADAEDLEGEHMESNFVSVFHTEQAPVLPYVSSSYSPANGATNQPITLTAHVTFSEAMSQASVEAATSIDPAVTHDFSWDLDTLNIGFVPSLAYSTLYTITVGTGAEDLEGQNMASPFELVFTTVQAPVLPYVSSSYSPANGATNQPITLTAHVTFSEAMSQASVEAATSIDPAVTHDFSWDLDTLNIGFVPSLAYSTAYTITVGTGAEDLEGQNMASPFELVFTTVQAPPPDPPFVSSYSPANGATNQPTTLTAQLIFSEAMSQASVAAATTIDPPVTHDFSWEDAVTLNIGFVPSLAYSTAYTITVDTGAEDLEGESMASPYHFSFTTETQPIYAFDLPDTGQTNCYNNSTAITCPLPGQPFYGQDAQYGAVVNNFTDNTDGTVTDFDTGLRWPQALDGGEFTDAINWYKASGTNHSIENPTTIDVCGSLNLAGQIWRLPNARELISIVNYGEYFPAIDQTFFDSQTTFNNFFWASESSAWSSSFAWYVDFSSGAAQTTEKDLFTFYEFYVRCVSGLSLPAGQFTANGTSTETDLTTGLIWQDSYGASEDTTQSWQDALAYCENLSLAAYTDWRLPNVRELSSMVDFTAYNPAIGSEFYQARPSGYWSSTTFDTAPDSAWVVKFEYGNFLAMTKTSTGFNYVRCVRGPVP